MEYKNIADIKKPVSRIVFGTAISAMMRGEHVHKLLDEVFAAGVNTFDLARNYGFADGQLGEWMAARGSRGASFRRFQRIPRYAACDSGGSGGIPSDASDGFY